MSGIIYKIVPRSLWESARESGRFDGAPIDVSDGFIHFSTADQVAETARRHFAGQDDLLLIAIDGEALGESLVYEPSRGGALFPHLYGPLPLTTVVSEHRLTLDSDGSHVLPELSA